MKALALPVYDDDAAFAALAANPKVASYPLLTTLVACARTNYEAYGAARGAPIFVLNLFSLEVEEFLKKHYASPPAALKHIDEMREESEHRTCPMCGSMHSGTLDHYLPKEDFPAFSVFSKNLVPACKCNSKRGRILLGPNAGERVLHPYYDGCLQHRLIRADFSHLGRVPRVEISLVVLPDHADYPAIAFHVERIVKRSAIRRYLAGRWSSLIRKPSLVIRDLARPVASLADLQSLLEAELSTLDELHESKNNWNSVFVAGLLQPPVLAWLFAKLSDVGRSPDGPLLGEPI